MCSPTAGGSDSSRAGSAEEAGSRRRLGDLVAYDKGAAGDIVRVLWRLGHRQHREDASRRRQQEVLRCRAGARGELRREAVPPLARNVGRTGCPRRCRRCRVAPAGWRRRRARAGPRTDIRHLSLDRRHRTAPPCRAGCSPARPVHRPIAFIPKNWAISKEPTHPASPRPPPARAGCEPRTTRPRPRHTRAAFHRRRSRRPGSAAREPHRGARWPREVP